MSPPQRPELDAAASRASIAARVERLPLVRFHYRFIALISLGAFFDFFDIFMMAYIGAALQTSGFLGLTAELVTTTSLAAEFAAACPSKNLAPIPTSRSVTALRRRSLPETGYPIVSRISAIPLIPIPPIPIK